MFYQFFQNIIRIFHGKNLFWHVVFCVLTAILVLSGFDWWYYVASRNDTLQTIGFTAGMLGFLIPVFLVGFLWSQGKIQKSIRIKHASLAVAQAGILGWLISTTYKVFTGRVGLPHIANAADISHMFQFGFYRGGAFQGWPSSHTSVAFAMSIALIMLFPEKRWLKYVALAYALYIGIGASVAFHWFSDFIAGAILGTLIGIVVGKSFAERLKNGF
jgi:membrane-associated phospholipid phosphatase